MNSEYQERLQALEDEKRKKMIKKKKKKYGFGGHFSSDGGVDSSDDEWKIGDQDGFRMIESKNATKKDLNEVVRQYAENKKIDNDPDSS